MPLFSDDEIRSVLSDLQTAKPAYGELLGLYQGLFLAQNQLVHQNDDPPDLGLDAKSAHQRLTEGDSLYSPETFPLDPEALNKSLRMVCDLATSAPEPLAGGARGVAVALDDGQLDLPVLASALLRHDSECLNRAADAVAVAAEAFHFLLASAVSPMAVQTGQNAATTLLTDAPAWESGVCPVCGHLPSLSTLGDQGRRRLICGFCQHDWAVPRIFCSACESRDNGTMAYFFSEEEAEYRVYTCEACGFYLKTVDLRLLKRRFYPPAEALFTLHLDMQAQEQGYSNQGAGAGVAHGVRLN